MKAEVAPDLLLPQVSARIAETMALNFPPERWPDLQRGLASAAKEFDFPDAATFTDWLVSAVLSPAQIRLLAGHLTVGETYFFREKKTFDVLGEKILPKLLMGRAGGERHLRVWSAGCCTGEEAYSLAILMKEVVPANWRVSILATDINERFLQKAGAGVYGEWSFRDTPSGFKERYFHRLADGRHAILPEIQKRVTFASLNLAEDVFPSLATDTNAMDIILCRNVLMYFTPPQVVRVVNHLRRALVDGGWLIVSPSEASHALFSGFQNGNFPGVVLYQRCDQVKRAPAPAPVPPFEPQHFSAALPALEVAWSPPPAPVAPAKEETPAIPAASPRAIAAQFYEDGRYAEAAEALLPPAAMPKIAEEFSLLTRALANQGRLGEALAWCDRWLAADKLDARGYYLRAMISQELGERAEARQCLQRAIYLEPKMVLGHFAMGNLARANQEGAEAHRHFTNTLDLLSGFPPEEILPESDGLTAGRLRQIIDTFLRVETSS